jgi:2-C-methyl-D-erythritol 4-phosphate cytidylyltransferase
LNIITGHLKRDEMTAIQTPQIFQFQTILKAYQTAFDKNIFCTDDTEVFSLTGGKSHLVDGDPDLFKITYRDDLKKAEILLKRIRYLWK